MTVGAFWSSSDRAIRRRHGDAELRRCCLPGPTRAGCRGPPRPPLRPRSRLPSRTREGCHGSRRVDRTKADGRNGREVLSPFGEVRESVTPRARPTRAQARSTVVDPILSGFAGRPGAPVSGSAQLVSRDGRAAGRRASGAAAPGPPRTRAGPRVRHGHEPPPGSARGREPAARQPISPGHHGDDRERFRLSRRNPNRKTRSPRPGGSSLRSSPGLHCPRAGVRTSKADAVRQRSTPAQRRIAICSTGVARSGVH